MKNFIQNGNMLPYVAPGAVTSGDLIVQGSIVGVATITGVTADIIPLQTYGVFLLGKTTAMAFTQGQKLYQDASTKLLTNTDNSGANPLVGYCFDAALSADTTATMKLINP